MDEFRHRLHQALDVAPPSPDLRARVIDEAPERARAARRRRWSATLVATAAGVAVAMIALVLISLKTAPLPNPVSPVPTMIPPASKLLGTSLSPVSLHAPPAEVLQQLGEPKVRTSAHGLGTPQWDYANGLTIDFGDFSGSFGKVWQISAVRPFAGSTAEGFRLGDTETTFRRLYGEFRFLGGERQLYVTDDNGVRLTVAFDAAGAASFLNLRDTRAFQTSPSPRSTARPSARADASAVYDAARNRVLMFGGALGECCLGDTWVFWEADGWREQTPATAPSPRKSASMAYDWARQTVVLFGGGGRGPLPGGDTWTWDGTAWAQQHPSTSPPAREGAGLAYDAHTQSLVLFGGMGPCCDQAGRPFEQRKTPLRDTWLWDGSTWRPASPPNSPPARALASMAFDPLGGAVVLFGGYGGSGTALADTWTWDGRTWTELRPASSPPSRYSASMVGGPKGGGKRANLVLFGGVNPGGVALRDTWTLDGTTWTRQADSGPPARFLASMAVVAEKRVVLFGGVSGPGRAPLDDLWSWDGTKWTRGEI